jgi:hypothetical protein
MENQLAAEDLMTKDRINELLPYFAHDPQSSLTDIKKQVSGEVSYEELRLVKTVWMQLENKDV